MSEPRRGHVVAWDLPTRLFHWTLLALVGSAWVSFQYAEALGDFRLKWHRWNGLAILVLLVWRLMWGLAGASTARFSSFLGSPLDALGYARDHLSGRKTRYLGHNPLGAWMVIALLAALLTQATLGLFALEHNDLATGPLYPLAGAKLAKTLTSWHAWLFHWLILPLVALHVAANILYGLLAGEPLIAAMVTGKKPIAAYHDADAATVPPRPLLRALLLLALSSTVVFGTILALGGRLP
ncbi:MAG: cytochrome b/b6 domain-containing protein [Pseudomonadota bacterium]